MTSNRKPMHFFAEIDLSALPRSMMQAERHYHMPSFPDGGRLFIFLSLNQDWILNEGRPVVVYAPDANDTTPVRRPPEELPQLDPDEAYVFHPEQVAPDGCSLITGFMAARPFLSARAENPLMRNMDRAALSEEDVFARDLAYAEQLRALGIDYPLPIPEPAATKEPFIHDIPETFLGFFTRGVFQFDWPYIFEVTKMAYAQCQQLPVDELETWIHNGDDQPRYRKLIRRFEEKKKEILAQQLGDKPGWWERISCDHVPAVNLRVDVQLQRWMGYARLMQNKGPMSTADKLAFVELLKLVERKARAGGKVDLDSMRHFKEHRVRNDYVRKDMTKAFNHTAHTLQPLHPDRSPEPKNDYGEADQQARNVQMFGAGYLLQHAAVEHEDKVLLFQLSDAGGLLFEDGIIQMWITHEDLSGGRFDRVITTMEYT